MGEGIDRGKVVGEFDIDRTRIITLTLSRSRCVESASFFNRSQARFHRRTSLRRVKMMRRKHHHNAFLLPSYRPRDAPLAKMRGHPCHILRAPQVVL